MRRRLRCRWFKRSQGPNFARWLLTWFEFAFCREDLFDNCRLTATKQGLGLSNERLKERYQQILNSSDFPLACLARPSERPGGPSGLSGLFLASVSDDYADAANKVMIVGLETRGWEPLKLKDVKPAAYQSFQSISHYVDVSMARHKEFFAGELDRPSKGRGNSFHNFVRQIASTEGVDRRGLIYSNLFCFAWGKKKGSPTHSGSLFKMIKTLSGKLLRAQIEVLKPDCIVFTGFSGGTHRRDFFDKEETDLRPGSKDVDERHLLEFTLQGTIRCFRVDHPSSRYRKQDKTEGSREGRLQLLQLLRDDIFGKGLATPPSERP